MATQIITNLNSVKALINNLKNIDKAMYKGAVYATEDIIGKWLKGKGGNGTAMKQLSDNPKGKGYKTIKVKYAGRSKRDLVGIGSGAGDLHSSFNPKKESATEWALTFSQDAMGKAIGNYNIDNNMMKVNKTLASQVNKIIFKNIFPKV